MDNNDNMSDFVKANKLFNKPTNLSRMYTESCSILSVWKGLQMRLLSSQPQGRILQEEFALWAVEALGVCWDFITLVHMRVLHSEEDGSNFDGCTFKCCRRYIDSVKPGRTYVSVLLDALERYYSGETSNNYHFNNNNNGNSSTNFHDIYQSVIPNNVQNQFQQSASNEPTQSRHRVVNVNTPQSSIIYSLPKSNLPKPIVPTDASREYYYKRKRELQIGEITKTAKSSNGSTPSQSAIPRALLKTPNVNTSNSTSITQQLVSNGQPISSNVITNNTVTTFQPLVNPLSNNIAPSSQQGEQIIPTQHTKDNVITTANTSTSDKKKESEHILIDLVANNTHNENQTESLSLKESIDSQDNAINVSPEASSTQVVAQKDSIMPQQAEHDSSAKEKDSPEQISTFYIEDVPDIVNIPAQKTQPEQNFVGIDLNREEIDEIINHAVESDEDSATDIECNESTFSFAASKNPTKLITTPIKVRVPKKTNWRFYKTSNLVELGILKDGDELYAESKGLLGRKLKLPIKFLNGMFQVKNAKNEAEVYDEVKNIPYLRSVDNRFSWKLVFNASIGMDIAKAAIESRRGFDFEERRKSKTLQDTKKK